MKALIVNCTLKASPASSNSVALAEVVATALRAEGAEVSEVRAAEEGREWSHSTGRAAAANLLAAARALAANPIPRPALGLARDVHRPHIDRRMRSSCFRRARRAARTRRRGAR